MNNFIFENKTKVYFGKGGVKEYLGCLLSEMAGTGDWQEGQRFSSGASDSDVQSWVDGLGM